MLRYTLKRLLFSVPVILGVTLIAFLILYLTPGDPVTLMLGARSTPEARAEMRAQLGLDQPVPVQYARWLFNVLRGDFGTSIISRQPVSTSIGSRLPYTLTLTLTAFLISILIGIPLGVFAAFKQNTTADHISMGAAMVFYSTPDFWLGLMFTLVFRPDRKITFPIRSMLAKQVEHD